MAAAIKLGDVVRDSVSGFEGLAVARTEWLYGCVRYGVEARALREGKLIEAQWFDEARLAPAIETSAHGLAPVQVRTEQAEGHSDCVTIHVHVDLDGQQFAEAIVPRIPRVLRSVGAGVGPGGPPREQRGREG